MANTPINDLVLVQDLSVNEFDISTGKVKIKIDPSSPIALISESTAGMVLNMSAAAIASQNASTSVSNTVSGSGATRSISTSVNGVMGAAVAIPDMDVKPTATAFDPATGILTTTLSDGSTLTANIGIAVVDDFLDTATYDATTATLKLKLKSGKLISVPLSDLVKVTTDQAIIGDGTSASPVTLKLDPASTSGAVSQSSAGLKVTLPAPAATTVSNTVAGSGTTRTLQTMVNGVQSVAVAIPDQDAQILKISGNDLSISNGNSVTLPIVPTTNTLTLNQSQGFLSTVNGIDALVPLPKGTLNTYIGFDSNGNPIFGPILFGPQNLTLSPVTGPVGSEVRSLDMTINGVVTSLPLVAQRAGLSQVIISWAFPAN